jgi:hypothetical protein
MDACPACQLPKEDDAWECDGCGHLFTKDFAGTRTALQRQVRRYRSLFWAMLVADLAVAGAIVYLAMHGFLAICIGLAVAMFGSTGHAAFKVSRVREQLRALDRRHLPLPTATIHER